MARLCVLSLYTVRKSFDGIFKASSVIAGGLHNYSWIFTSSTQEYQQTTEHWNGCTINSMQSDSQTDVYQTQLLHLVQGSCFYQSQLLVHDDISVFVLDSHPPRRIPRLLTTVGINGLYRSIWVFPSLQKQKISQVVSGNCYSQTAPCLY